MNEQTKKAIENYNKSLELDARNQNAKAMLAKMGHDVPSDLGKAIEVPASTLEKYVGTYEILPQFKLAITLEDGQLFVQATNQPKFPLFASTPTHFFLKVVPAQVEFIDKPSGTFNSLKLEQGGQTMAGKRVQQP